ncbi:hypothetical protein CDAR_483261 [Caerostris darwini]|uniref:MULE transposase domain-containing protein n=1 Tax=Caerostris darwini TaxID=1538125 RepID=A0AAV4PZ61_9ARAC|nr:hypothetical protein CDAR_483261 [Caerostris darwini]
MWIKKLRKDEDQDYIKIKITYINDALYPGMKTEDFLLVLDDKRDGFPAAFIISNHQDRVALEVAFKAIKKEVTVNPNIIMTGNTESFCNERKSVFGEPKKKTIVHLARGSKLEKKRSANYTVSTLLIWNHSDRVSSISILKRHRVRSSMAADTEKDAQTANFTPRKKPHITSSWLGLSARFGE